MSNKQKILIANWKMHKTAAEAQVLMSQLLEGASGVPGDVEIFIACPFIYLKDFAKKLHEQGRFKVAAQNCHHQQTGAFTGEISAAMLKSIFVDACLIGHSERRTYCHENDDVINRKIKACHEVGVIPVLCVGETLTEREKGGEVEVVTNQLAVALQDIDPAKPLIIGYEPVWAIGTGVVASAQQAQDMHKVIRDFVRVIQPERTSLSIIYGGSCNDSNAGQLFGQPDIDGGLIGSASLAANSFIRIAQSFANV
jgi:triosephosphate isomerase